MHNPAFGAPATKRVQAASMGGGGVEKSGSAAARVLGSGAAGVLELALFHPVDTVAKRLMSYEARMRCAALCCGPRGSVCWAWLGLCESVGWTATRGCAGVSA